MTSMKQPPVFNPDGGDSYLNWKNDVEVWCLLTEKTKQGPAVYISLQGDAKEAVRSIPVADLAKEDGVKKIIDELDKIYLKDETTRAFCAIKSFIEYRRTQEQTFTKFMVEFNNRLREVKKHNLDFDDGILAFFLLMAANLTEDHERLVRATATLTFQDMKDKLQKVFGEFDMKDGQMQESKMAVKEECFFARGYNQQRGRGRGRGGSQWSQRTVPQQGYGSRFGAYGSDKRSENPKGPDGNIMRCYECDSTMHLSWDCSRKKERWQKEKKQNRRTEHVELTVELTLVAGIATAEQDELLVDTLSKAVLDCGCTKTVAGTTWFNEYLSLLSKEERDNVENNATKSKTLYRFGDGKETRSQKKIKIPMFICGRRVEIDVEVVENNIPLLLGRPTMTLLGMNIDFGNHSVNIDGREYEVEVSSTGHYTLPVSEFADKNTKFVLHVQHLATYDIKEKQRKAEKLHRQFAHASKDRLLRLLKDSGCQDKEFMKAVEDCCNKCEFCQKYRHPKPKPIVSLPKANDFNQVVTMDLKEIKKGEIWILHMVDCATRYTAAAIVRSKRKEVIVQKVFQIWMAYFGSPLKFHNDCGGEFSNEVMKEMNEIFGIETSTTPGEAPWSNGIVERGNTMLFVTMMKTKEDVNCSLETALAWAVCAKNSLMIVSGYSFNQLVFGRNFSLPSVENQDLPALDVPHSEIVRTNLNALHKARENFIRAEASDRIKRALKHNVRTYAEVDFAQGEKVFYRKRNDKHWRGPGRVLGKEGNFVMIRHGASYHRCHPCRLIKKTSDVDISTLAGRDNNLSEETDDSMTLLENNDNGSSDDILEILDDHGDKENIQSEEETSQLDEDNGDMAVGDCGDSNLNQNILSNDNDQTQLENNRSSNENSTIGTTSQPYKEPYALRRIRDYNEPGLDKQKQYNVYVSENQDEEQVATPKPNTTIQYTLRNGVTNKAHVLSIQRKLNDNSNCVNVLIVGQDEPTSINWAQVSNWNELEATETILTLTTREEYKEEVMKAKERELQNLKENDVFECVQDEGQKTVSCRWVFQEKVAPDGKTVLKGRLVARGFEERLADKRVESPTCSRQGLRLTFMVASTMNWEIQAMDISSAFLQGNVIQRTVYVKPPKELQENGEIWKLKRCLYGLSDAPREWYDRVCSEMKKLGGKVSLYDKCVFLWHEKGRLIGMITTHVDDFEYAGTPEWQDNVIKKIMEMFKISKKEKGSFKYIGLTIEQNGSEIFVDQNDYCSNLNEVKVHGMSNEELSTEEKGELRSLCGQVLWATSQTRPDAAFEGCQISNVGDAPTNKHLSDGNRVIRKLKSEKMRVVYPSLGNPENIRVVVYGDGSHASLPSGASQGGNIVFVAGDSGRSAPISWSSKKLDRITKSPLATEVSAIADAADNGHLISSMVREIFCLNSNPGISLVTDSFSLKEHLESKKVISDPRLRVDIGRLREMEELGEVDIKWVPGTLQLADPLTKKGASTKLLRQVLVSGVLPEH